MGELESEPKPTPEQQAILDELHILFQKAEKSLDNYRVFKNVLAELDDKAKELKG